jgi:transposase
VGKIENRFKVAKHFRTTIEEASFTYERDESSIAQEAALDGIYVIRTNVPAAELSRDDTVLTYKRLSVVERAFRSLKSVTLKLRPIHHHKEERVRAHVFVCMLAYYAEWHLRRAWASHDSRPTPRRHPT